VLVQDLDLHPLARPARLIDRVALFPDDPLEVFALRKRVELLAASDDVFGIHRAMARDDALLEQTLAFLERFLTQIAPVGEE
jgi:hypothetical protein